LAVRVLEGSEAEEIMKKLGLKPGSWAVVRAEEGRLLVEKRGLAALVEHARSVEPLPDAPREEPSKLLSQERRGEQPN